MTNTTSTPAATPMNGMGTTEINLIVTGCEPTFFLENQLCKSKTKN